MERFLHFYYQDTAYRNKNKANISAWLKSIAQSYGQQIKQLNITFCSDEALLAINQEFLQHDYYTDIITFDYSEPPKPGISGELYISVDRTRDNARQNGEPEARELLRVIAHGLLHLLGHKDKSAKDQKTMRTAEEKALALLPTFTIFVERST